MRKNQWSKVLLSAILVLGSIGFAACQKSVQPVVQEQAPVMPTDYPKTADVTLKKLAPAIPSDVQILAAASYGSVTRTLNGLEIFHLVDSKDLINTMEDLGTHYLLNPSRLKDYFKAGLHTGSGFAVGYRGNSLFLVLDALDTAAFRKWWDNFINEEYGRPAYQENKDGGRTLIATQVMGHDFCTMVITPGAPVMIVMGPQAFPNSAPSLDSAREILAQPGLSGEQLDKILKTGGDTPVSIWMNSAAPLFGGLPEIARNLLAEKIASGSANLDLTGDIPTLRLDIDSQNGLHEVFAGAPGTHTNRILASNPITSLRLYANTQAIESLSLPLIPEKYRNTYKDIQGKLTQKLLKLDVSDQIIYNMGGIWLALYDLPMPSADIFDTPVAVYIPFGDSAKSDAFFAKLNILKRFIPEKMATIEQEDGLLHASLALSPHTFHVGYQNGLIGIGTESTWDKVRQVLVSDGTAGENPQDADGTLVAGHLDLGFLTKIPFIQATSYGKSLAGLPNRIQAIDVRSDARDEKISLTVTLKPARQ